jgi:DHA3 family multidrug efflux protein-like MFS transporter
MLASSIITLVMYCLAGLLFLIFPKSALIDWQSLIFWLFGGVILLGGVVESLRNIALSTTVTLLVPKEDHDKANGLVGAVQGVAFMVTSVFSGLSIGLLGMGWTLVISVIMTAISLIHLFFVAIPEKEIAHDPQLANKKVDVRGSLQAIRLVPGLMALILFTTFNNFIGGVYMALMDPYGLTLFSVEAWGIVLGATSTGFIIGGLIIGKKGLGKNPLRTLLLINVVIGILGAIFTIRELWWLYAVGIFLFMCAIPAVEAAEQTVIQRVVPFERQGRVFGFAQSVEAAASPITAFMIGPIAQFWLIPYMNGDEGKAQFGWLLGQGEARGMALVFVATGIIAIVTALLAFRARAYRVLSDSYAKS